MRSLLFFLLCVSLVFPSQAGALDFRPEDILTILPKDAIPAILEPSFDEARDATWIKDDNQVIGVEINGESRAYPVAILSNREIVNDTVGGVPIAVTW